MSAVWPSALPVPSVDGYTLKRKSATKRTEMEEGPARVRRRFRRVPTFIPQSWRMTQFQFGLFEWWFENSIDAGAAWFAGPAANGTGLTTVQLRFVDGEDGPYEAKPLGGGLWQVTAVLEADQMPQGSLLDFWPADEPTLDLDFITETYGVAG